MKQIAECKTAEEQVECSEDGNVDDGIIAAVMNIEDNESDSESDDNQK